MLKSAPDFVRAASTACQNSALLVSITSNFGAVSFRHVLHQLNTQHPVRGCRRLPDRDGTDHVQTGHDAPPRRCNHDPACARQSRMKKISLLPVVMSACRPIPATPLAVDTPGTPSAGLACQRGSREGLNADEAGCAIAGQWSRWHRFVLSCNVKMNSGGRFGWADTPPSWLLGLPV